jgi:hypothetical protein
LYQNALIATLHSFLRVEPSKEITTPGENPSVSGANHEDDSGAPPVNLPPLR